VAIAFVHAKLFSRLGGAVDDARRAFRADGDEAMSDARARPMLVLAKDGGKWEIIVFQNMKIAAGITEATL